MPFLTAKIDRAIVMTQYDLRGFGHPAGFRMKKLESPKCFSFIPSNFVSFAVGLGGGDRKPTHTPYVSALDVPPYEDYLEICKQLASDCDLSQKEAIQLIIQEIIEQGKELQNRLATGQIKSDKYVMPLEKDNWWGLAVLALAEAFEVPIELEKSAA